MKLRILLPALALLAVSTVTALQAQEIRTVTVDMATGPMAMGMAGGAPMATGNGVIFGQITEADSTRPVPGAIVSISLQGSVLRVMADGQGRFGFRNLPAGRFNVAATRPGWVDGAYGRTRPAGPTLPLALADGERVSGVTIPIWRYASIGGRVVDDSGEPIVNVPVRILKRTIVGGRTRLTMGSSDNTDDRGTYRVGMLEPGEYIVAVPMQQNSMEMPFAAAMEGERVMAVRAVAPAAMAGGGDFMMVNGAPMGSGTPAGIGEDGKPLSYPTVFYPNVTASTRAMVIGVTSGEERGAVDFQLRGVPTSRVSGLTSGPDGPTPNLQVTLVPAEADEHASPIETITGFSDPQGRFTIEGVPPGQYVLRAIRTPRVAMTPGETTRIVQGDNVMVFRSAVTAGAAPLPTDPTLWAEMQLAVGGKDVTDVAVSLRPGLKMTGTVQFTGGAERPTADRLGSIGIMLEPADPRPGVTTVRGRVEPSGQFSTVGVPPGRYFVRVSAGLQGWTFQSAQAGSRDASVVAVDLDSADLNGVVIAFTDRPSELSGQVQADGPLEAATVIVFPSDQSAWVGYGTSSRRLVNVRADKAGNYKVTNLPAGEYLAAAIPDKLANDWQNPKFLETLVAGATQVRVRDGDKAVANLKVSR